MVRRMFAVRVDSDTPEVIEEIAQKFRCLRVNKAGVLTGSAGVLLDKIATGHLIVASTHTQNNANNNNNNKSS